MMNFLSPIDMELCLSVQMELFGVFIHAFSPMQLITLRIKDTVFTYFFL
jgi:hypothetical protein